MLSSNYRADRTDFHTRAALDAFVLTDYVQFFDLAVNTGNGTVARATRATNTLVRNEIRCQRLAHTRRTTLFLDMRLVLIAERTNR